MSVVQKLASFTVSVVVVVAATLPLLNLAAQVAA
jgi:hypothetical protein